jgi:uncharacterized Tic20 family protein
MNKPSQRIVFLAVIFSLLFAGASAFSISLILKNMQGIHYFLARQVVPGSFRVSFPAPGYYRIWYEYAGVLDGWTYATGEDFPSALSCSLKATSSGEGVRLTPEAVSSRYSIGDREGKGLWEAKIDAPGLYEFSGAYTRDQSGPQVVIAITPSFLGFAGQVFKALFPSLLLVAFVFIVFMIALILAMMRLLRTKTPPPLRPPAAAQVQALLPKHKTLGAFCHLSALSCWLGIPFGNIVAPLILWLLGKNESEFVNAQGKESLNFQLSISIYAFFSFFLMFILIGIPILIVLALLQIITVLIASVQASEGKSFRYPVTMRLIK